jgi:orotate phosphoribosyltransferase
MLHNNLDSMPQLIPSSEQVMSVLTKTGAFRSGHFAYPNGEHTPHYFQMPLALRHFQRARELGVAVSRLLRGIQEVSSVLPRVTIITPGSGGIPIAFNAQVALTAEMVYWAEREDGQRRFRQYVKVDPGNTCVIVDDIVRSGSALKEVSNMVKSMGGKIVGCASVIRFTTAPTEIDGVPIQSLVNFETEWYKSKTECPLCKKGDPVEDVRF